MFLVNLEIKIFIDLIHLRGGTSPPPSRSYVPLPGSGEGVRDASAGNDFI